MRFGLMTDLLASGAAHSDLACACEMRVLNTIKGTSNNDDFVVGSSAAVA
jgi:hypothetical protein